MAWWLEHWPPARKVLGANPPGCNAGRMMDLVIWTVVTDHWSVVVMRQQLRSDLFVIPLLYSTNLNQDLQKCGHFSTLMKNEHCFYETVTDEQTEGWTDLHPFCSTV